MKVYGVYSGCVYEGGGVGEMFLQKDKCIEACKKLVRKEQRMQDRIYKNEPLWKPKKWTKVKDVDNYWSNRMDCIFVQEFEVIE